MTGVKVKGAKSGLNLQYDDKSGSTSNLENIFKQQNDLFDSTVNEIMDYELYGRYKTSPSKFGSLYSDLTDDEIYKQLNEILDKNMETQESMLETIETKANRLTNSYGYVHDMNRNQEQVNQFIEDEMEILNKKGSLTDDIQLNRSETEKYYYETYKNKALSKMILVIVLSTITILLLTMLSRKFGMGIYTEGVNSLVVSVIVLGTILYSLSIWFDIQRRDKRVYTTYDIPV